MNIGKTLSGILGAVAPTIGTALGGPLGGMAARALTDALGIDVASTEDQIVAMANNATPEQLLALKKADNDFKAQMKALDIDLAKVMAADVASARQMQVQVKDWTVPTLAFLITLGFFSLLWLMAFHEIPVSNKDILNIALGALATSFAGVVAFYFGSSSSSQKKDDTIKALSV